MPEFRILPAGDSAILVQLGQEMNPTTSHRVHALAADLFERRLPGLGEVVPGYASLLVHFDPLRLAPAEVTAWLQTLAKELADDPPVPPGRRVEIPTVYDGPDLISLAVSKNLTPAEVIHRHAGREYLVYLIGFTPGFAYLGEVDQSIAAPRLASPRQRVPAGSVGIAGQQTGIYPLDSPGGWQLIGRTHLRFFNPQADPPCLLAPGDSVIFCPVEKLP